MAETMHITLSTKNHISRFEKKTNVVTLTLTLRKSIFFLCRARTDPGTSALGHWRSGSRVIWLDLPCDLEGTL
jgi:hypothetical protein